MIMENMDSKKHARAKKRVDELKGFYIHLTVYIAVNAFILINIFLRNDNFWQWGHFFSPIFWGIGLAFHASKVFSFDLIFGKGWEERKIKEYMEKDRKESDKFTKR